MPVDTGNGDIAHAVYNGSSTDGNSGEQVTELTTIDLIHTPAPFTKL